MSYFITYLAGAATVFIVYHFNLQPKLRAERDAAIAAAKAKIAG